MNARQISVAVAGAVLTGAIALVASGGAGLVSPGAIESLPGFLVSASTWLWKVAAVLVAGYVVRALFFGGRGGGRLGAGGHLAVHMPPPPEPPRRKLPPEPPDAHLVHPLVGCRQFAGRGRDREALTEWFRKKRSPSVCALAGPGGAGKSSLAWVWVGRDVLDMELPGIAADAPETRKASRVTARSRPDGVLWWSFDRPGAGFSVFLDEAIAYMSGGSVQPTSYLSSRFEKVETLLSHLRDRRFLVVLDGFERELRAFTSLNAAYMGDGIGAAGQEDDRVCSDLHAAEFLRQLVEQPLESKVLMTTQLVPAEIEGHAHRHDAAGLDPADAVALMRAAGVEGDDDEIIAACQPYGFHPLALRVLAGVVTDGTASGRIRNARRVGSPTAGSRSPCHHVVEAALDVLDPATQRFICHLAAFRRPLDADQVVMFDPFGGARPVDEARRELVARGLLAADGDFGPFDLHPLIRRCAYERLGDASRAHRHLAEYFGQVRLPVQINSIEEIQPAIEQYHHLVGACRYEDAYVLLSGRLATTLRDRFADQPTMMKLLRGLFDGRTPLLREKQDQAWAIDALAKAYSYSGETRRAQALCEANVGAFEARRDQESLAMILGNLAGAQARLGRLEPAEATLRRLVELMQKLERLPEEAIARNRLGLLLATRGAFDDALAELDAAFEMVRESGDRQIQSVCFSYYAQRGLLMGDAESALEAARKSRAFVEEVARRAEPNEHDYVRSGWLLAAALIGRAAGGGTARSGLEEAERYLSDALSRCRRADLVGFEPDLLLAWARWHRLSGKRKDATRFAHDALAVAERCDYRLKRAEVHNFLGRLALDAGKKEEAIRLAQIAWDFAWCDGPPYALTPALDEAESLLTELGVKRDKGEEAGQEEAKVA